jgi:hypothetical protein
MQRLLIRRLVRHALWMLMGGVTGALAYTGARLWTATSTRGNDTGALAFNQATIELACYSDRLRELGEAIHNFESAKFETRDELRAATQPIAAAIKSLNESYVALSISRVETTALMLQTNQHRFDTVVCQMANADQFQWVHLRPAMNSLLVNIIVGWQGDATPDVLTAIKEEQDQRWREVDEEIAHAVQRISDGLPSSGCNRP